MLKEILLLSTILLLLLNSHVNAAGIEGYCFRIIDGDTLLVRIRNRNEKIRLIGIDTPEIDGPYTRAEYLGKEASEFTSKQVKNKTISLQLDNELRDKYGRMLAYVYLMDGTFLNKQLIERGYARVYKFFNYSKKHNFLKIEKKAKERCAGIWKPKCKSRLKE